MFRCTQRGDDTLGERCWKSKCPPGRVAVHRTQVVDGLIQLLDSA